MGSNIRGLVLGDIHLRARKSNSFQHMRTLLIKSNLYHLRSVVRKRKKYDYLILAGDIYDEPYIELGYDELLINWINIMWPYVKEIYIVSGNHDSIGGRTPYGFMGLSDKVTVVDSAVAYIGTKFGKIAIIPWGKLGGNVNATNTRLYIGHCDIFNVHGDGMTTVGRILRRIVKKNDSMALISHHHKHFSIGKNIHSVGAFVSNGFDEARYGPLGAIEFIISSRGVVKIEEIPNVGRVFYVTVESSGRIIDNCLNKYHMFDTSDPDTFYEDIKTRIKTASHEANSLFGAVRFVGVDDSICDRIAEWANIHNGYCLSCSRMPSVGEDKFTSDMQLQYGKTMEELFMDWMDKEDLSDDVRKKCTSIFSEVLAKRMR